MRRGLLLLFLAPPLALLACRQILGIEPLGPEDSGVVDAAMDTGVDAGTDTSAPEDSPSTGPDGGDASSADATPADASHADASPADAGPPDMGVPDMGPPDPATVCLEAGTGGTCAMCCHEQPFNPGIATLYGDALDSGCACGGGEMCASSCNGTGGFCTGGGASPPCGPCLDMVLGMSPTGACAVATGRCQALDQTCAAALECLQSCF